MGFFSFLSPNKSTPIQTATVETKSFDTTLQTFSYNVDYSQPIEWMQKTSRGYLFGINGMYPQELNALYHKSPLHASILNFKKLLSVGNGYSIEGLSLDGMAKISLNQLTNQFDMLMNDVAMDLFIHSRVCLKITWNKDNTKILKIERISPDKIHINDIDEEMNPIDFLYNWDWNFYSKYPTKKYPKFDPYNKTDKVQLYMYQVNSPGMRLYAEPSYQSALNWVVLDAEMSQYHKANILNSINPSILIQYFEKPGTKEEKQQVLMDLNNSFAGARKTGRAMVTFSDGKELAPTVTQMEPNQLDKTFLSLTDTIQRQICYAHQIDPQLLGLKTPGSLGNSGEFLYSFNLFNSTVIQPAQYELECIFNKFIAINGLGVKLKFNEPDIVDFLPTVEESVQMQKAAKEQMENEEVLPTSTSTNDVIRGLSGRQHQGLLRILKQVSTEKLTKDQASVLLSTGYGLTQDDIDVLLGDTE